MDKVVLYIEDEMLFIKRATAIFAERDIQIDHATDGALAYGKLKSKKYDGVMIDIRLEKGDPRPYSDPKRMGIDILRDLKRNDTFTSVGNTDRTPCLVASIIMDADDLKECLSLLGDETCFIEKCIGFLERSAAKMEEMLR